MSQTLYQQIKELAAQKPHLLQSYQADLHVRDREVLDAASPGDQWVWVLQEYGTTLLPCPVLAIEQMMQEDITVHPAQIQQKLRELDRQMQFLTHGRQNVFCHLVCRMDGTKTAIEVESDRALRLMSPQLWDRFNQWREKVIGDASRMSLEMEGSGRWWNLCSLHWSSLDWLYRYRDGEEEANSPAYRRIVAQEILQIMQQEQEGQNVEDAVT